MPLKSLTKLIQSAQEEQTPEKIFLDAYDGTIKAMQEERVPSKHYKPSSLGGCLRNVYFQRIEAPLDPGSGVDVPIMEMGHNGSDRHDRIQAVVMAMKEHGYDVEWIPVDEYLEENPIEGTKIVGKYGAEYKLFNSIHELSLMCDGIIKIEDQLYILEIKTEISFKWQGRTEIDPKHKVQASCYSLVLGIDKVLFLYENRDMLRKKAILDKITQKNIHELVLDKIEEVENHLTNGTVPPKTEITNECNYCRYKEECKRW